MADIEKICRETGESFVISDWEQDFLKRMDFPLPEVSDRYSLKRRLAFRNARNIYKNTCDMTGESIVSIYSPDKPYKVYSPDVWWSDKWDPRDYGRDYDFDRPFFEQFKELKDEVPRLSLINMKGQNSAYCNLTTSNKNCYLVFGGDFNEDCMYSLFCMHCKDCSDVYLTDKCELCYDILDCNNCYACKYSQDCSNCKDSAFLYECRGCSNCFGCVGLANKQYYILNKPYSREEYFVKIKEFGLDSFDSVERMKETYTNFRLNFPHRFAHLIQCENCTGDNIINAKNCIDCFDLFGPAEDLWHMYLAGWGFKDSMRCNHIGHGSEVCYETLSSATANNCAFTFAAWDSHDVLYSKMVINNSSDVFGCCQMRKAHYCILNKQYSKDEYFEILPRIISHMKETGEWGEFFPMEYSPFCYNESVANDLFPMEKEEVLAAGLKWRDEETHEIGSGAEFPDSISGTDDSVLEKTFVCEKTGRSFKINEKELKLYRKIGVPVPHYAPETRNNIRLGMRKARKSWDRQCEKCGLAVISSYSADRPEKIYCEKCFLDTIE